MSSLIHGQMAKIMAEVGPIAKDRKNTGQGYMFRGIDDVYNTLNSIMAKHEVFTTSEILDDKSEERTSKSGSATIYRILKTRYTFWAADGSFVHSDVIGEGMDAGDKASNKAMSVAHKYALIQAFCIPTDSDDDPEGQDHAIEPKNKPALKPPEKTMSQSNAVRQSIITIVNEATDVLSPDEIDSTAEKIKACPDANIVVYAEKIKSAIEQKRAAAKKPVEDYT